MNRNQKDIHIGPGAASLMLIVVVLSLSALTILMLISAENDDSLSRRSAEVTASVYVLQQRAEEASAELDAVLAKARSGAPDEEAYRAEIRANLPDGMKMEGDKVSFRIRGDARYLECVMQINPPTDEARYTWVMRSLISEIGEGDAVFD